MFEMHVISGVVLFIAASLININEAQDLIVQLPKGKIRGHILESGNGNPIYAFQEIPYAAPPVGNNRFQLAKQPEPWSGILNTTKNTVACYQNAQRFKILNISEDCLYINVYSPVAPGSQKRLPVLVWFHGGGYDQDTGAIQEFGPKYITDHGIIVVTLNYRLGPFGFLTTVDDIIPANLGLKDQRFALEWVNENIELFGGNSSSVTIAGQSAGADAVGRHILGQWPNSKVLFHGAIMQSGCPIFFGRSNNARDLAFKIGRAVDNTFSSNNSTDLLRLLQKTPAEKIFTAAKPSPWPIIEEDGPFSYQMYESLEKGDVKKIPVVIGFTSEEFVFQGSMPNVKEVASKVDKDPSTMLDKRFKISSVNRTIAGNLLRRIYTNTTFQDNIGAFVRYVSDESFSWTLLKQADLQSKYTDVYLYQFSYKGELGGMMNAPNLPGAERVGHTEDLKYFWSTESNSDLSKFPEEDRLMLHQYSKIWTNFIKYGNPTPTMDSFLQNITWRKVDPSQTDNIQYLNINKTLEMQFNPRYHQKIKKVFDYYITSKDIN